MRKNSFLLSLFILLTFCIIFFLADFGIGTIWSSPNRTFNITPDSILLNWTNNYQSNITILANSTLSTNISIEMLNDTTSYPTSGATPNYTQGYPTDICHYIPLLVRDSNGVYNNTIEPLNGSNNFINTNVTLIHTHLECYPGKYFTDKFIIRNFSSGETANITVYIDIPISINNTLNNATGVGTFSGTLPSNATTYNYYYLNTSGITNASSVYVNVSWSSSSQDIDLFLFDNSNKLLAKSINKTCTSESLFYNFLPSSPAMYEIRVYGNSTSSSITYSGNVIFSTLNSTNTTLNFGIMNVSTTTNQTFALNNTGNLNLSSVIESKDLYHVTRFSDADNKNFTVLVPDSDVTSRLKVSLNWTGASNYSLYVYNPSGNLIVSSVNKYFYANVSNAMQEEYIETTSLTRGTWKLEVKNNTNINDTYSLTVYQYVANPSRWIATNYSSMTFNGTSVQNYQNNATVNFGLTIQNESMNGAYEGYIRYTSSSNQLINIPITFNVTTPMLVVNNTINSETYRTDEDYGANITRILYFNITNPGNYDLNVSFTDSGNLSCYSGSCSGYNSTFTYNSTNSIPANGFSTINVNLTFNSSMPKNTVYSGWIYVNGTNNINANLTSHPYSGFTINLRLNLTDLLDVRLDLRSGDWSNQIIENSSLNENITIKSDVYYINETQIPDNDLAGMSNFTMIWLQEGNVTSNEGKIPASGNLTYYSGVAGGPWCSGSCPSWGGNNHYYINATVPANKPGGQYNVYVTTAYSRGSFTFGGTGTNKSLIINNTGLFMSTNASGCSFGSSCNSSTISLNPGNTTRIYLNVSNFGPLAASTSIDNITFSESCTGYSISSPTATTGCSAGTVSGNTIPLGINASSTNCTVYWTVTAASSSAGANACTGNIIGYANDDWFNPSGINVTIAVNNLTTSTTTPGGTTTPTNPTTPTYNLVFSKAEILVPVQQNSSNSTEVQVKNTGSANQTITFKLVGINSTWYTINATSANIASGGTAGFKIRFAIGKEDVKDYLGSYNATSTSKSIAKNFTLRVLPAPEEKVKINDTLALYKVEMIELETEINQSRDKGMNVTLAEQKLKELKSNISQAENYIKQGDDISYFNAKQLLPTIKSLIDDTKNELSKAKQIVSETQKKRIWIFLAIGGGVVALGVILFLFWPTKGYHAEGKVYLSEKESLFKRLKTKLSIFRKKVKK